MTSVTSLPGIIPYAGIDLMIFNSLKDYYHHTYPDKPAGNMSPGRQSHSNTTLCTSLAIIYSQYTAWRQHDFNVHG